MKRILAIALSMMIGIGVLGAGAANASVSQTSAGVVATSSGRLNVRSGASSNSAVVGSLNKGSYVTLISKNGSWWYLEYDDGRYGYSHADYIRSVSSKAAVVKTQSGNLNVRSGAGTSNPIVGSLAKGEKVLVLSSANGWSRVLYRGGKTGYASSQYLALSATYAPVTLAVPDYKQTDGRWANVLIGDSGKTMRQIGCATTAVAMMESYRQGRNITPDVMARQLSYSASGNLYWPSDYRAVYSSEGYLQGIYNRLLEGKPVLFGAKRANGSQHWVVISGYSGGNTLSANGFVIRDPGSSSRTTLQQLLDEYPSFYKYFHY